MQSKNPIILKILEKYKPISLLNNIKAALDWDMNVNLPPKGGNGRGAQMAYLEDLTTDLWLDKELRELLEQAKKDTNLTQEEQSIIKNIEHLGKFYFKVPKELIIERANVTTQAFMAWQKSKIEDKFDDFKPHLQKIVHLNQQIADYLGYKNNPYDALLDLYEPGLTTETCSTIFNSVQPELTKLLKKIQSSTAYKKESNLTGSNFIYDKQYQKQLAQYVLNKMGYDFESGRMDTSAHPFETTLDRDDVRITIWYRDHNFSESIMAAMHEGGHALYEQGINPLFSQTPLESGVSYAIHESQSRFWENQIGRNPLFLQFLMPILQAFYPEQLGNASFDEIMQTFNNVRPSLIRVEADEVTYNLHIILRFQIERDLINGKISVDDLPKVWSDTMHTFLGIRPKNDREGVLQDVHWSLGSLGYFPTYALGNLYSAQIANKLKKQIDFNKSLETGDLGTILKWLRENIHQYGKLYWPDELITKISGEKLNPQYFIDYLNEKYSQIYSLK